MSQIRILDFAANITAEKINTSNKFKFQSGVLTPGNVVEIIKNDTIAIKPISFITQEGVLIYETATKTQQITLGQDAKDYTLIYRHTYVESSGGSAATLELTDGFYAIEQVSDAVIICWIKYPGGSAVLDETMIFEPRKLKIVEPSNDNIPVYSVTAPFESKWIDVPNAYPALTTVSEFDGVSSYTKISNPSNVIVIEKTKLIPIVCGENPPGVIHMEVEADYQASVVVTLLDENGLEYIPSNNAIANTAFTSFSMRLPNFRGLGNFVPHSTYQVKLLIQLNPGKSLKIKSLSVSDFNLPITAEGSAFNQDFDFNITFNRIPSVLSFFDPTSALPVAPTVGDRYISSANANGWLDNYIYTWNGASWDAYAPTLGDVVLVENELISGVDYVFGGTNWVNGVPQHLIKVY